LTFSEAVYLELAVRRNLPLATLDREIQNAVHGENVVVISK